MEDSVTLHPHMGGGDDISFPPVIMLFKGGGSK